MDTEELEVRFQDSVSALSSGYLSLWVVQGCPIFRKRTLGWWCVERQLSGSLEGGLCANQFVQQFPFFTPIPASCGGDVLRTKALR